MENGEDDGDGDGDGNDDDDITNALKPRRKKMKPSVYTIHSVLTCTESVVTPSIEVHNIRDYENIMSLFFMF